LSSVSACRVSRVTGFSRDQQDRPGSAGSVGPRAALEARLAQYRARDLLDRRMRRVDERDAEAREERLGRTKLEADLVRARVAPRGAALEPDGGEPLRRDREAIQLLTVGCDRLRQLGGLEVVLVERIVRREDAVLEG